MSSASIGVQIQPRSGGIQPINIRRACVTGLTEYTNLLNLGNQEFPNTTFRADYHRGHSRAKLKHQSRLI